MKPDLKEAASQDLLALMRTADRHAALLARLADLEHQMRAWQGGSEPAGINVEWADRLAAIRQECEG